MSEDSKGSGNSGQPSGGQMASQLDRKKPRATFGDVMQGIPAGKGGAEGGPRPEGKGGKGGRKDRPRRERSERASAAEAAPKGPQGPQGPIVERKPGSGPMVVIRRIAQPQPSAAAAAEVAAEIRHPEYETATPASSIVSPPVPGKVPHFAPLPSVADEVHESESFAEMFEASSKQEGGMARRPVRVGEKVSGKIFQLGADTAFISLGGKSEAMLDLNELKDEQGILRYGIGDEIEAHVVEAGAKGILLSKTLAKGAASLAALAEARATGMPVEGLVLSVNKGGYEVAVGDQRAFVPMSQMDLRFVDKPEQFIGEKLRFRVTEVRERKVVLSRRAILEEEQKELAEETRKTLDEGKVVRGKISGVRDFGAFVDLGGIEGMIPVSELSHSRVGHPSEVVKMGDEVEVEVLRIEAGNPTSPDKAKQKERITLSLRARQEDPWQLAANQLREGEKVTGKVVRLQPFGAFVEVMPGVDGLIHVSALSNRRVAHPKDVVQVGQEVQAVVEKLDPVEKRLSLRLWREGEEAEVAAPSESGEKTERPEGRQREERAPRPVAGQAVIGTVDRIESYGVFLKIPGGRGLIPASETGTERGTDLRKHFKLGQELKAQVLEVDPQGKIRLSMTAAERAAERAEVEAWTKSQKPKGGGKKGFGTFADLLKDVKLK